MPAKHLFPFLILLTTLSLLYIYNYTALPSPTNPTTCNLFKGKWTLQIKPHQPYDHTCPFHRNSWNCLRNKRGNMGPINSWRWTPEDCVLKRVDPLRFLTVMKNKNVGFVGDSLNENFVVSILCSLRRADFGGIKWKKMGAWRGGYFPKFNVTVGYHRAVLLAKYQWQPNQSGSAEEDGSKGIYRVDVDIPADDWAKISNFYDVLVFNTGHWWGYDKFPKETPLVFYQSGKPIEPPLEMRDGLGVVLKNMISYIQKEVPVKTLNFWRLQSPRHFYGGDWNQNGSCLLNEPLKESELDLWFDPTNNGVNKEARELNHLIKDALQDSDINLLDLTHLSEFRADAHPAIWLGKKDAVAVWGQDCMHWCLPGVPDTWFDILAELILNRFETR